GYRPVLPDRPSAGRTARHLPGEARPLEGRPSAAAVRMLPGKRHRRVDRPRPDQGGSMTRQTVLVTGGTGYVAGWCVAELLRQGYRVRSTIRSPHRYQAVLDAVSSVVDSENRLSFAVADLTSDDGWDAAVAGVDYVLHVASPLSDTGDLIAPARDGTLRV